MQIEHDTARKKYFERQSRSENNYGMPLTMGGFDFNFPKGKVEWHEAELDIRSEIVNKRFDVFDTKNTLGFTLNDLTNLYKEGKIPKKHIAKIDEIRSTLHPEPRIFVETTDKKQFSIYDGWHTAVAFAIEGKNIPCIIAWRF